jgi:hypothetical protein
MEDNQGTRVGDSGQESGDRSQETGNGALLLKIVPGLLSIVP